MKWANIVFALMLAALFTHELDAMTQSEWRLLYVLRDLPSESARDWFVALHVPIFAAMLWSQQHPSAQVQRLFRRGMAMFCIVHAGLHWRLRNDPMSSFDSALSLASIHGAAVLGLLYLLMPAFERMDK